MIWSAGKTTGTQFLQFQVFSYVRKVIYTMNAIESLNSTYSEAEPPKKRVSKRYSPAKSAVSGYFWSYEKMDYYHPGLDAGLWRTEYHVWRTASEIRKNKRKDRRQAAYSWYAWKYLLYIKQGWKAWFKSFSPFIIIEESYLQKFLILSLQIFLHRLPFKYKPNQ